MSTRPWSSYFSVTSILLLFLSVAAFSDNLFTDIRQPSNSDPKFVIHGLFGLAWYVLLATQANLIRVRNVRLHRKLGIATFIVAIGVVLTTLYLFIVLWKGWANMTPEVRANRLFLPGFVACVLLAWRWRAQSDWHKRLILSGTFFMQGPVLSRAYDALVASWAEPLFPAIYTGQVDEAAFFLWWWGVWIGLFVSLALYDWKTLGRIHRVTIAGFAWFVVTWLISYAT